MKKEVCVGLVGSGYAAYLHGNGYEKVCRVNVRLKTVVDLDLEKAKAVQKRYGFEQAISSFDDLLADPEIDVVDIVTPPFLHPSMAAKAMKSSGLKLFPCPLLG